MLSEKMGIMHISSGDIFRENLKSETELGLLTTEYMNRGELVPDDITIPMVHDRLSKPDCKKGAVLDGFPRTPAQAEALGQILEKLGGALMSAPYIEVPAEVLIDRLGGRWTCRACGTIYHEKHNTPNVNGCCDFDGTELYQREDDKPETVERRICVYLEQTSLLIEYYREQGLLYEVDGTKTIEEVAGQLEEIKKKR